MNLLLARKIGLTLMVVLAMLVSGCATVDPEFRDPSDPYESFNRSMYRFNTKLDKAFFQPVARGYRAIVPAKLDRGITNFFGNLGDIRSAINNLLQLKLQRAATSVARVLVNSTLGLAGFLDVASNMNLPRYKEDFGQTLGVWGAKPGPYLVLPFLGPSSRRDTVGKVVDWFSDPLTYVDPARARYVLRGLDLVDKRADLLGSSSVVEKAALDPYSFVRDAYRQRRKNLVHDGNPPVDERR